eukprot:3730279-Rhodomonas_salina.2
MQGPWDDFDTLLGSAIIVWTLIAGDKGSQKAANQARGVVGNGIDLCGHFRGHWHPFLLCAAARSFTAGWNDSVGLFWSRYVIGVLE